MPTGIDDVVERVTLWRGDAVDVTPLSGGLTNQIYLVTRGDERFVVRIPGPSTELLAVDRANERHNAEAAATTGVSPPILEYLEDWSVMVLAFIDGETMSAERLRAPSMPARMAASLHRLHAGPPFLQDFDMFRITERYLGVVADCDVRIPEGFRDRMETVVDVERVLAVNAQPRVPCHNDLLAENYIDDGRQLWVIDFEYSGNDDPCFELGDTAQECGFDAELKAALCAAYFGRDDPIQLARMELYAMMADVGWTLWAAIQAEISDIDFDFWGWAVERWDRAVGAMDGPGFAEFRREATR
ncbi:MAG: choline/ethanolamine kinase family protein [Actinomycetota bacterium]